jgi:hypothetical protein
MKTGLLWFDDDPRRTLEEKVQRAQARYMAKFGCQPNCCFVHHSIFGGRDTTSVAIGGVEVQVGSSVLPHHFWIGLAERRPRDD